MKAPPMVPMPVVPQSGLNCIRTGHPCGTDTWMVGTECGCVHCQRWLGRRDGYAAGFAAALAMLREPSDELVAAVLIQTEHAWIGYEGNKATAIGALRAAASALADSAGTEGE